MGPSTWNENTQLKHYQVLHTGLYLDLLFMLCAVKLILTDDGDSFLGFPGREYSEVFYHSLPLGATLGWCSWPKATQAGSFSQEAQRGNRTPNLWLHRPYHMRNAKARGSQNHPNQRSARGPKHNLFSRRSFQKMGWARSFLLFQR